MKKIQLSMFSAGMLALVLSGCNNDDPVIQQTLQTNGRAISFEPVTDKPQRSGLQRVASLTTDSLRQFSVWAWNGGSFLLDNKEVTRAAGGRWSYNPVVNWPPEGSRVDFYAVSTNTNDHTVTSINMVDTSILFQVKTTMSEQRDLLVAVQTGVAAPAEGDNQVVSLKFQHALSRVRVQARNLALADSIKITGVTLHNLLMIGYLKLTPANVPAQGLSYDPANPDPKWMNAYMANDYVPTVNASGVLVPYTPASYVSVLGDSAGAGKTDNSLMVLPQLTGLGTSSTGTPPGDVGSMFYLQIRAQRVNGSGAEIGGPTDYYIAVPDPHPSRSSYGITFEPGREYTFRVTLNYNREIHFDGVQVNDWDRTAGTGGDGNVGVVPATP